MSAEGLIAGAIREAQARAWDECASEARNLDLVDGVGRNWLLERNPYDEEST